MRVEGYSVALCFDLGFPSGFRPGMIRATVKMKNVSWIQDITQALDLPLHEAIAKSRVINSGWNFMLIICACTV